MEKLTIEKPDFNCVHVQRLNYNHKGNFSKYSTGKDVSVNVDI